MNAPLEKSLLDTIKAPHFPIYLDYSATTPVDPRVADKMIPFLREQFGNPASRSHMYGWTAEKAVEDAREEVAKLVNADSREIIWTSGATESNNLAIKGAAQFYKTKGKHIITIKTEHKAVLDTVRELERQGFDATYLQPQDNGLVTVEQIAEAVRPDTILISVMMVNNEIGVIQPIAEIGEFCRKKGIIFHCDAAQATGKVEIDLEKLKVDLMSFSAHKTYGPKGIGALYVRRKPRVRIEAQIHGGGHERGLRSGTLAPHQIVGMGEAFRIAREEMATELEHIRAMRDRLAKGLQEIEETYINGDMDHRVPHNLNVSFNYVEGESLIMAIKDIAVSSGSACTSASLEPSYVLRALGRSDELAHSSIRFTIGRFTTEEDIDFTIDLIIAQGIFCRLSQRRENLRGNLYRALDAGHCLELHHARRILKIVRQIFDIRDVFQATAHEALDRDNRIFRIGGLRGLRLVADVSIPVRQIAHHRRQQRASLFVGQHFGNAVAHGGDQRIGGTQINPYRQPMLMRCGGHARFGNLKKRHRVCLFR
jgi:cysteine desulfurase